MGFGHLLRPFILINMNIVGNFILVIALLLAVCSYAFSSDSKADPHLPYNKGDMNAYRKRVGAKYLEEKAIENGVFTLKSGMLVEILKPSEKADAKSPNVNSQCRVTYAGTLHTGDKFDAGTHSFAPNQVIPGWTEAMQMMTEGDKWRLHIPYNLAYGERGAGAKIPPFSPLVFDIEILEVMDKGKAADDARALFESSKTTAGEL